VVRLDQAGREAIADLVVQVVQAVRAVSKAIVVQAGLLALVVPVKADRAAQVEHLVRVDLLDQAVHVALDQAAHLVQAAQVDCKAQAACLVQVVREVRVVHLDQAALLV